MSDSDAGITAIDPPIDALDHEHYMRRAIALTANCPELPFGALIVSAATGEVLVEPGQPCRLKARYVFDLIVQCAHATGEPGLFFIDQANRYNPVPALGQYEATNPCG